MADAFESRIDIFLRMRPIEKNLASYEVDHDDGRVNWVVPRQAATGMVNHQRERYSFTFTGILDTDCKQDLVFETVARKVVLGALDGFNGTIFAYGQTGSGKTYTITGGTERYVDRGIIPRAISLIYSELANRSDNCFSIHFSYMEIYNETGYDLLNPDHETKSLEDLPKVVLLEDDDTRIHLRNLSAHLAMNEEEALNLLFMGDTNRMISSTPMNMASSRSHCIFTACIEARKTGEDVVRKSKLHLVDLAGSERVSKTGVDGQILREAKYINLSLHFLEQVIIALQEKSQGKSRTHIPYRNSMMTSVLRDSIGGNCRTVMIANVSIAQEQLEETISTCRFAQRVAMVSNQVMLNEEVDPNIVIKRLKQEVKDLKAEVMFLRGEDVDRGPLTDGEIAMVKNQVNAYVYDLSPEASFNCGGNMLHIRAAFQAFKELATAGVAAKRCSNLQGNGAHMEMSGGSPLHETIQNLNRQLSGRTDSRDSGFTLDGTEDGMIPSNTSSRVASSMDSRDNSSLSSFASDRRQAFDLFWRNYPSMDAIEENKALLRKKYGEAKLLGEGANKAREKTYKDGFSKLRDLKREIEHLHLILEQSRSKVQQSSAPSPISLTSASDLSTIDTYQTEKNRSFRSTPETSEYYSSVTKNAPAVIDYLHGLEADIEKPLRSGNVFKNSNVIFLLLFRSGRSRNSHGRANGNESIMRTGNESTDADIKAFYKARSEIMKLKQQQQQRQCLPTVRRLMGPEKTKLHCMHVGVASLAPVVMELGGNAPCIVEDLVPDLEGTIAKLVHKGFYQSG
ncbi:kinesin-like protein KIF6 [Selaginella moellendorffii]|uniref:kinesin-like protein KIF6 n=1 Tax=Selaginella moellendorffii TaxID=88036 RepID=UPI000D1C9997|nr:kinesin-like protein KIF6 [Selaginella moellendorffii]|eukprot:XP_024521882.1 kinesin-like protein KIF6 [Selaginella moellendorffii]